MSYEDFVEGIKPEIEGDKVLYKVKQGIFMKACAMAEYQYFKVYQEKKKKTPNTPQTYSFDAIYNAFIEKKINPINLENKEFPEFEGLNGNRYKVVNINSQNSIIAVSASTQIWSNNVAPLTKANLEKLYNKYFDLDQLDTLTIEDIRETTGVQPRSHEFFAIFKAIKEYENKLLQETSEVTQSEGIIEIDILEDTDSSHILEKYREGIFKNAVKDLVKDTSSNTRINPVVLIIDEINRGNIAAIFGELITLIEDTKRTGLDDGVEVTLPYSENNDVRFSVPPNLYIIGTMNTADRSVEALDTALRRRFVFKEMMPDVSELMEIKVYGITLSTLLATINNRIARLLSRDYMIGHSYFLKLKDKNSSEKEQLFKEIWFNSIMPLLQEYFYGHPERLARVIGEKFLDIKKEEKKSLLDIPNDLIRFYADDSLDLPPNVSIRMSMDDNDFENAIKKIVGVQSTVEGSQQEVQ